MTAPQSWNTELLLSVVLDGIPPSVNHAYFNNNNRSGPSRTMTSNAKKWKGDVEKAVKNALQHTTYNPEQHRKRPLRMDVVLELDKVYVYDIDNHQKLLQDAVCAGMELDDRYIVSLRLDKMRTVSDGSRTTVRVWRLYD